MDRHRICPHMGPAIARPTRHNRVVLHHAMTMDMLRSQAAWETTADHREDYDLCIHRERWQEVEVLKRAGMPAVHLIGIPKAGLSDGHMTRHGDGCHVVDAATGEPCEIAGRQALVRGLAHSGHVASLVAPDLGCTCADTRDGLVETWYNHIGPSWTLRHMRQITVGQIRSYLDGGDDPGLHDMAKDGYVFMKTIAKGSHGHVRVDRKHLFADMWDTIGSQLERCGDAYAFLVSESIRILEDGAAHPKREYRTFVIDGAPCASSRYVDYEDIPVPTAVTDHVAAFAAAHQQILPPHYVVDVAETDRGIAVIELNGITGSGRYRGNTPDEILGKLLIHEDDAQGWKRMTDAWASVQAEDAERLERIQPGSAQTLLDPDEMLKRAGL